MSPAARGRTPTRLPGRRLLRAGASLAAARRREPLLRNGHLLTVSSLLTAGVGAAYWVLAARLYGPDSVGTTYSAVSAGMFLAGIGQLNLANTMVRFVPRAGTRTRRLVLLSYLVAGVFALLLGTLFVLLVPHLVPALSFLHAPLLGTGFAVATAGYAVFVMQDGVLTGLRRADWVVLENALFSAAKVVLLALFASAGATAAILGSWGVGLAVSLAFTNTLIFVWAVPRHHRLAAAADRQRAAPADRRPAGAVRPRAPAADRPGPTPGYLAADWIGSLCWLAAITLPPIILLERVGAAASAYFSVAWLIAYAMYQFAINMCASLMVEAAHDPRLLRAHYRRVLRHAALVLGTAAALVVLTAPWLLAVFGADYTRGGTTALRLLALSAVPNLVTTAVVAVSRVLRRMRIVVVLLAALTVMVLGLTLLLLPSLGTTAGGAAWLIAQCVVAGALLWKRSWWLPPAPAPEPAAEPAAAAPLPAPAVAPALAPAGDPAAGDAPEPAAAGGALAALLPIRRPWPLSGPIDRLTARRIARELGHAEAPDLRLPAQGRSDVLVLRRDEDGVPVLAVKHPRNDHAVATLAHEWEVLQALAADERLGEWRRLLPSAVSCRLDDPVPVLEEAWLPGVNAAALVRRRPADAPAVAAAALGAISELHRATGRPDPTAEHRRAWVDRPVAVLRHEVAWCRGERGGATLTALADRLHRGLRDQQLCSSWTHGDYHPGNVLLGQDRRVCGVIDWGDALEGGPSEIDDYSFVLTLRCLLAGRQLGRLLTAVVRAGALAPEDRALLAHANGTARPEPVRDGAALPLLAWLWHVAANVSKSPRYGRSHWWVSGNVIPVLEEVARCPGEPR